MKIKLSKELELNLELSDEMLADYKECMQLIALGEAVEAGKDCGMCSWKDVRVGEIRICELQELEILMERKVSKEA